MVFWLLSETENATGAYVDTSGANMLESGETFIVAACCDDRRVVLAAGVQVVVVRGQTSSLELIGLALIDHAESDACLHVQRSNALDHCSDVLQARLTATHVTPCSSHAESCTAIALCDPCSFQNRFDGGHLCSFEAWTSVSSRSIYDRTTSKTYLCHTSSSAHSKSNPHCNRQS
jgi:hypothetical protein